MMKELFNRDFIENFIKFHKSAIIKAFAGILFFAVAFFVFCIRDHDQTSQFELTESSKITAEEQQKNSSAEEKEEIEETKVSAIYVDVGGAVKNPAVYEMSSESRVFEVIEKAGGLTSDADTSTLNLAQILQDQDKLIVPTKREVLSNQQIDSSRASNTGVISQSSGAYITNGSKNADSTGEKQININTATSEELQTITGIGPATAEKIITYRQEQGKFEKIEDITKVSGIGEKTFQKFKAKIMV